MRTEDATFTHSSEDGEVLATGPAPVRDGFYELSPGWTRQCNAIYTGMRRGGKKRKKKGRRFKKKKL